MTALDLFSIKIVNVAFFGYYSTFSLASILYGPNPENMPGEEFELDVFFNASDALADTEPDESARIRRR